MLSGTKFGRTEIRFAAAGATCFLLLVTLEIATSDSEASLLDYLVDVFAILLTIGTAVGVALLTIRLNQQHEEKMLLIKDLEQSRTDGAEWRKKVHTLVGGIRNEMDLQFQDWGMTDAEREIGLLILKGLSHKEIAALRGTSEATVRQQANSIYHKSSLPGKTAFSAYFLEDLVQPQTSWNQ